MCSCGLRLRVGGGKCALAASSAEWSPAALGVPYSVPRRKGERGASFPFCGPLFYLLSYCLLSLPSREPSILLSKPFGDQHFIRFPSVSSHFHDRQSAHSLVTVHLRCCPPTGCWANKAT